MASGLFNKVVNGLASQGESQGESQGQSLSSYNNQGGAGDLLSKVSGVLSGSQQRQQQQPQRGQYPYYENSPHGGASLKPGFEQWDQGYQRPMAENLGAPTGYSHGDEGTYAENRQHGRYMDPYGPRDHAGESYGNYDKQSYQERGTFAHTQDGYPQENGYNDREVHPQPRHGLSEQGRWEGGYPNQNHGNYAQEGHNVAVERAYQSYPRQSYHGYENNGHTAGSQQGHRRDH